MFRWPEAKATVMAVAINVWNKCMHAYVGGRQCACACVGLVCVCSRSRLTL